MRQRVCFVATRQPCIPEVGDSKMAFTSSNCWQFCQFAKLFCLCKVLSGNYDLRLREARWETGNHG